jgi:hypothetical protein
MQTRPRWFMVVLGLAAGSCLAQAGPEVELASCVRDSAPLRVPAGSARAPLDAADGTHFHEAAQARYPLYQRGGFAPAQVLLLQRGNRWVYVTVTQGWRDRPCFTAVFAAERFDFTAGWLQKYRPRAPESED